MRLREEGELLLPGVRCSLCERFSAVGEGNFIPWCCRTERGMPIPLKLEHHTETCLENCGFGCRCPCHEYRPQEEQS